MKNHHSIDIIKVMFFFFSPRVPLEGVNYNINTSTIELPIVQKIQKRKLRLIIFDFFFKLIFFCRVFFFKGDFFHSSSPEAKENIFRRMENIFAKAQSPVCCFGSLSFEEYLKIDTSSFPSNIFLLVRRDMLLM